jgi:hypothetical protein
MIIAVENQMWRNIGQTNFLTVHGFRGSGFTENPPAIRRAGQVVAGI